MRNFAVMTTIEHEKDIIIDDKTRSFILAHRTDDVHDLALRYSGAGIDLAFVLDQIQGWQTARHKLPSWAAVDSIVYPPHLNMEQCSSEATARYKCSVLLPNLKRDAVLADLTGGLGVDFAFMAPCFRRAVYVERDTRLCAIARHNFAVLGLTNAEVVCGDGVEWLRSASTASLAMKGKAEDDALPLYVYIDPARRDVHGRRVYGIEDCTPDVLALRDMLLARAARVMIKLSPMLDWHAAVRALGPACREVHVVSVGNECKELVVVMGLGDKQMADACLTSPDSDKLKLFCVNDSQRFSVVVNRDGAGQPQPRLADSPDAQYLYVPNASVMKAGVFGAITSAFPVAMADANSHLFLSGERLTGFPGRSFTVRATTTMNKQSLRQALSGISRANVAVRNFPLSADALRRKLRLADGGDTYVFATTVRGKHVVYIAAAMT